MLVLEDLELSNIDFLSLIKLLDKDNFLFLINSKPLSTSALNSSVVTCFKCQTFLAAIFFVFECFPNLIWLLF